MNGSSWMNSQGYQGVHMYQQDQNSNARFASSGGFGFGGFASGFGPQQNVGFGNQQNGFPHQSQFSQSSGFPSQFGNRPSSQANFVANAETCPSFTGNVQRATTAAATHPWYFDSGATDHITNSLQNIVQP